MDWLTPSMTYVIFIGDILVMGFMVALVVWVSLRATRMELEETARIPLEDEADIATPSDEVHDG